MFYSQLLLSKKGPLGTIWIAAHCHKRLKKEQVQQTNITSSVDKILLDEALVVTYRVLGHLLLGVVRIYSKKVEYLFHDCNHALEKLGDFASRKRSTSKLSALKIEGMRAPSYLITRPKRFELDTFELDASEDHDASSGHVASREKIMLSDARGNKQAAGFGLSSKYKEDISYAEPSNAVHTPVRDVHSPHLMDRDFGIRSSPGSGHLADMWHLNETRFSLEERFEPMTLADIEIQIDSDKTTDRQINGEQMEDTNAGNLVNEEHPCEKRSSLDEQQEPMVVRDAVTEGDFDQQSKKISQPIEPLKQADTGADVIDGGSVSLSESFHVEKHLDLEQNRSAEASSSRKRKDRTKDSPCEKRSSLEEQPEPVVVRDAETERDIDQRSKKISQRNAPLEQADTGVDVIDGGSVSLCESFLVEKQLDLEQNRSAEASSSRKRKDRTKDNHSVSLSVDVNQKTKPSGSTSPDFIAVRTPASKERARISRKRKCVFDKSIVISNNELKRWIKNADDLVCKRRKAPHTSYRAWSAHKISSLPQSFEEPLIPCSFSVDGLSAICKNKSTMAERGEAVEVPLPKDLPESHDMPRSDVQISDEQIPVAPAASSLNEGIPEYPSTVRCEEQILVSPAASLRVGPAESPFTHENNEQTPIAPATPVTGSNSIRFHDIQGPSGSHREPASSTESQGAPPIEDQEWEMAEMDEEINSSEGDASEKHNFSLRTRKVAKFLLENFLTRKGKKKSEVNLSLLLKGKRRRESARVFHEILVLKSGGWINVRQDKAYGDICLQELPSSRQNFEAEGVRVKS